MSDFLHEMAQSSRDRAAVIRARTTVDTVEDRAKSAPPPVPLTYSDTGFDIIAEVKLASPSGGRLMAHGNSGDQAVALAKAYADNGAAAISVLTEPLRFDGELAHLELAARSVPVPVMRKDFLVDPIQVLEARASGASGVLLIARMLPGDLLEEMTDLALDLGMFALVEIFDGHDLESAVSVFDREILVGVNCRDLSTLEVDFSRLESLAPLLPDYLPTVAESGISTARDAAAAAGLGYPLALVGSSLVTQPDPGAVLAELLTAGRRQLSEVGR